MTEQAAPAPTVEDLRLTVEVQQLAINRLTTEVAALTDRLADDTAALQDQLASLVASTAAPPKPGGDVPRPWSWRDLDEPSRVQLLRDVGGWLDWMLQRYPVATVVPSCWAQHPEMVEELVAAHRAWLAAYRSPEASPYAAAEWHDRWLPGLEQRLTHRWKSRRCDDGHQPTINLATTRSADEQQH